MTAMSRTALFLLAATLLASCSFLPGAGPDDPFRDPDGPVTLLVRNNNFNDATLWIVGRGDRRRLGTVSGKVESSFTVPTRFYGDVWYVEIDLVGGDWCRTDALPVDPGDVLELQINVDVTRTPGCYPPGRRPGP